jgi:hypothetical protein
LLRYCKKWFGCSWKARE